MVKFPYIQSAPREKRGCRGQFLGEVLLERQLHVGGRRGRGWRGEAGGDGGALPHGEGDVPVRVGVVGVERRREEDGRADLRLALAAPPVHVVLRPEAATGFRTFTCVLILS